MVVIGAGAGGLTTALCLRRAGHQVTIVADRLAPDVSSVEAGALWRWPTASGLERWDAASVAAARSWSVASYQRLCRLAADTRSGVYLRPVVCYRQRPVRDDPVERRTMGELAGHVRGFRHDAALIAEGGVSPAAGIQDAYSYLAPTIDTDTYLAGLLNQAVCAGTEIVRARIEGDIVAHEQHLLDQFEADAIVNCAGLGSTELTGESMYPLRTALVQVHNDGRRMPRITAAHCLTDDAGIEGQNTVAVIPRGTDRLVLGELIEPGKTATDLTLDSHRPTQQLLTRCIEFLPMLREAQLVAARPVRIGLLPARPGGPRVEHQPGTRILHNVGHGAAALTLSWGCALRIVELLQLADDKVTVVADKVAGAALALAS